MYNFAWTDVFHMLTKIKEFLGFTCVYISLNNPCIYRVNGNHGMPKRLDLWDEMQWRVRMCGPVGGTGMRLTSALICKMSKRKGKLSDKALKDNICWLDQGVLKIITLILLEVFGIQNMMFHQSIVMWAWQKHSKISIVVITKPTHKGKKTIAKHYVEQIKKKNLP